MESITVIILPDKNISRSKFLMPVPKKEWRTLSQIQSKDMFGRENKTIFLIKAKLNDGYIKWKGIFYDREDFDAFLLAIANKTLSYERELWDLPNETWTPQHKWLNVGWMPDLGENLNYIYAVTSFLTSPTGSLQTYNVPNDFNIGSNIIEVIGAGGSGSCVIQNSTRHSTGGGGGAYSKFTNISISVTTSYQIGTGGAVAARTGSSSGITAGNSGGDTWFGATTLAGLAGPIGAGAKGGGGGIGSTSTSGVNGPAGGTAASGYGDANAKFSGGRGGNTTASGVAASATGGGGAAGPGGAGGAGGDLTVGGWSSGGTGGNGLGGAGTAGNNTGGNTDATGGSGNEIGGGYGSGGGTGGKYPPDNTSGNSTAGIGGNYGAGGGALVHWNSGSGTKTSGKGADGLIAITYTPLSYLRFNMPMLGL